MTERRKITIELIQELSAEYGGICADCGAEAYGVEPDARNYVCEECGHPSVFGAEECLFNSRFSVE